MWLRIDEQPHLTKRVLVAAEDAPALRSPYLGCEERYDREHPERRRCAIKLPRAAILGGSILSAVIMYLYVLQDTSDGSLLSGADTRLRRVDGTRHRIIAHRGNSLASIEDAIPQGADGCRGRRAYP